MVIFCWACFNAGDRMQRVGRGYTRTTFTQFREYYSIQPRSIRRLVDNLLTDERHLLLVGQTGSGKTTFIKALLGGWRGKACVIDPNNEYPQVACEENSIRREALIHFLRMTDPTLPQEMLLQILFSENGGINIKGAFRYDIRVAKALKLRLDVFNALTRYPYTLPVVRVVAPARMPYTLAVIADRLTENSREILVIEESQYYKDQLGYVAAEGRKRQKKLVLAVNDPDSVNSAILHNSIIALFRSMPKTFWTLGIPRPTALKRGEFLLIDPQRKTRKYKLRMPINSGPPSSPPNPLPLQAGDGVGGRWPAALQNAYTDSQTRGLPPLHPGDGVGDHGEAMESGLGCEFFHRPEGGDWAGGRGPFLPTRAPGPPGFEPGVSGCLPVLGGRRLSS